MTWLIFNRSIIFPLNQSNIWFLRQKGYTQISLVPNTKSTTLWWRWCFTHNIICLYGDVRSTTYSIRKMENISSPLEHRNEAMRNFTHAPCINSTQTRRSIGRHVSWKLFSMVTSVEKRWQNDFLTLLSELFRIAYVCHKKLVCWVSRCQVLLAEFRYQMKILLPDYTVLKTNPLELSPGWPRTDHRKCAQSLSDERQAYRALSNPARKLCTQPAYQESCLIYYWFYIDIAQNVGIWIGVPKNESAAIELNHSRWGAEQVHLTPIARPVNTIKTPSR